MVVDSIEINGNARTLDEIVLRELNFRPGDSISLEKLPEVMRQNSFLLLNTGLFTKAEINIKKWILFNPLHHCHILQLKPFPVLPIFLAFPPN